MHGVIICDATVSVEVLQSHNDANLLYQSIMLDDPPVTKIGDAIGQFILWPTKCLSHSLEAYFLSFSRNPTCLWEDYA